MTEIQKELFSICDIKYREFQQKLIPTINPQSIIGVRTPILRKYAKNLLDKSFMLNLPHDYLEENSIHSFLIQDIRDYNECVAQIERFLPFVDNWAVCDSLRPRCFKTNPERLICDIKRWLASEHTYTMRFGIEMLMIHFLDEYFKEEYLEDVAKIKSDEYYVNMMIAWYFSTALAKKWDSAVCYIEKNLLPIWIHNKTIQKSVESYCISGAKKDYLKTFKRKVL